jgi:hypothetical protein
MRTANQQYPEIFGSDIPVDEATRIMNYARENFAGVYVRQEMVRLAAWIRQCQHNQVRPNWAMVR